MQAKKTGYEKRELEKVNPASNDLKYCPNKLVVRHQYNEFQAKKAVTPVSDGLSE